MVRHTGSKQDNLRRFPLVLPPFDQPQRLFVLAKGRFDHGPAVLPISHRRRFESGQARDEDGIRIAAFVLGRAHHPLPGRPTEALGAEHSGHGAARAGRRRPWPEVLAPLLHPALVAALGQDLRPATAQPVAPLARAKAPVHTQANRRPPLPRPAQAAVHLLERAFACRDSGLLPAEPRFMETCSLGTRGAPERLAARCAAVAPPPGALTALGSRPKGHRGKIDIPPQARVVEAGAGRDARAFERVPGHLCKLRDILPGTGPQRPRNSGWCPSIAWMNMNKRSVRTLAVHS